MADLSVIVPCFNEAPSLSELHREICATLEERGWDFELLFVDDGSTDESLSILESLAADDHRVGLISFRRNFGKAAALDAGFRQASGEVVVTIDGDLQDKPSEIPSLVARLEQGYDLVTGWKQDRQDPLHKTIPSRLFNATVRRFSRLPLHDFNCGLKAFRREAIVDLRLYGEMHRFIPVLLQWQGFAVDEVPVGHRPRRFGSSKYGASRLGKGFFDLLTVTLNTRFRSRPLHLFGLAGAAVGGSGALILGYLVALWFLDMGPIGNRPLLLFGALMVMVGIQLVSTGLLGELITRGQQAERPAYVVRSAIPPRGGELLRREEAALLSVRAAELPHRR
jgi:glycosyltransferase involved in cell wall biosynthesis